MIDDSVMISVTGDFCCAILNGSNVLEARQAALEALESAGDLKLIDAQGWAEIITALEDLAVQVGVAREGELSEKKVM